VVIDATCNEIFFKKLYKKTLFPLTNALSKCIFAALKLTPVRTQDV